MKSTTIQHRPQAVGASPKRQGKRRVLMAATAFLAVAALAACGGGSGADGLAAGPPVNVDQSAWDKVLEAANEEGAVTAYVSLTGTEALFDEFRKAYPKIDLTLEVTPTTDLVARLDQEMEVGAQGADVAFHAQPNWFTAQEEAGNLGTFTLGPDAQAAGWTDRLGDKSVAEIYGFPYTIGYRTTNPKPSSIKEVLDNDPDASIGIVDPRVAPGISNIYEELRQEYGDEILDQLAASNYKIISSSGPLANELAAGSFDYGLGNIGIYTSGLAKDGAPVSEAVPTGAVAGSFYNLAIPKTAPHPNAAQVLVNWLMSKSGQEAFVRHASPASVPVDVEGAVPWDSVSFFDPADWTREKWDIWLEKYWVPRFG